MKHVIFGIFIIVAGMLLMVAIRTKDPVQIRFEEVISWIQSDHPDLLSEKEILEIYPELKVVKSKILGLRLLENRINTCTQYPENCSTQYLKNRNRNDGERITKLQEEINLMMENFTKRHHLVSSN
jgi:hypothetical protein